MSLIDVLKALAITVRNEKKKEANSAVRIGDLFIAIIDFIKSVQSGEIRQDGVDTYNDTSDGKTSLLNKYPRPELNWTVLVRNDESNGNKASLYKWNGSKWINLETVVYIDDIAINGGYKGTSLDLDKNSTRNGYIQTTSNTFISINSKDKTITFKSGVEIAIYHGRRFFNPTLSSDIILSYDLTGYKYKQIKYLIDSKTFSIDDVIGTGDFIVIGYVTIDSSPQVSIFANLYNVDGIPRSESQYLTIKTKLGLDLQSSLPPINARVVNKIKLMRFIDCHRNVKLTYFGNLNADPNGIRLRDAETNDSILYETNLESNKLYNFPLVGGGSVQFILDFSGLGENDVYINSSSSALFYDKQFHEFTNDGVNKYPWDNSSSSASINALKAAIKDIDIRGYNKDKFYSFWMDTQSHNVPARYWYRMELVEADDEIGTNNKTVAEYIVEFESDIKNEFQEVVMWSKVAKSDIYCRLLMNTALLPSVLINRASGAYIQANYKFHSDVFNGGRHFRNKYENKHGVGFHSFKLKEFDNKWMCNEEEAGYDVAKMFALARWDSNTFVNNVYEDLRTRHSRFITRSNNPLYSIEDVNSVMQHCYLYDFKPENYSKTIFINTGTHSRESEGWLGTAKMLQLIYDHWQEDEALEFLRFNVRFLVIPVQNVWGLSVYPRTTDTNKNGVNLNRNWHNGWVASSLSGTAPFSEIETSSIRDIILSMKDEIDFIGDNHTTVNNSFGDYSLSYGTPARWGYLSEVQRNIVGYLLTKNVILEDKRIIDSARTPNVPYQPYFGTNAYGNSYTLSCYVRDKLNIPSSTVEHSDFVWSDKLGTSVALKFAVEWYINYYYNVARNL